ncbi:hypothetical protein MBM_04838 [Drepanopeziza brunnea f. sp. 'multigermtubi' MB_m1]|uniref:Uncharacterized protein n=1 Tax=Marssonina brunnea f. sp. multigermtubi (strain MB_m1) TaxID=1072389 RepID=K1WW56_MARBU|nr:uncharacterized protein MBM_04838 [Drepanopeziza brunnea f. sp. 'multigermtubi' MB_m1]EKD17261.1 hypothetical protein MBM_04838 [Drepanopeziza brunnea f. sp. 'multigermtubi' MB_m1]
MTMRLGIPCSASTARALIGRCPFNMSNNNGSDTTPPNEASSRARRGSLTSQAFNNIFGGGTVGRSNSTSGPTPPFPGSIATAAAQDQRRRMSSISTLGLGTSPTQVSPFPFAGRRSSVSTANSEAVDENAIDDEEGPGRGNPATPFTRRISFGAQALRSARGGGGSPGTAGRPPSYSPLPPIASRPRSTRVGSGSGSGSQGGGVTPPSPQFHANKASTQSKPRTASDYPLSARPGDGSGFNLSEQFRSRAQSAVSQTQRPSFSVPTCAKPMPAHERAKSVSEMAPPPTAVPAAPPKPERQKPDAFQERILKGDFVLHGLIIGSWMMIHFYALLGDVATTGADGVYDAAGKTPHYCWRMMVIQGCLHAGRVYSRYEDALHDG